MSETEKKKRFELEIGKVYKHSILHDKLNYYIHAQLNEYVLISLPSETENVYTDGSRAIAILQEIRAEDDKKTLMKERVIFKIDVYQDSFEDEDDFATRIEQLCNLIAKDLFIDKFRELK